MYANGKVCLSLLGTSHRCDILLTHSGTWPGPPESMWQPWKSTLLQVLLSIQSMILCDNPYANEPAFYNSSASSSESRAYSRAVRLQSVRHTILGQLNRSSSDMWAVRRADLKRRHASPACTPMAALSLAVSDAGRTSSRCISA